MRGWQLSPPLIETVGRWFCDAGADGIVVVVVVVVVDGGDAVVVGSGGAATFLGVEESESHASVQARTDRPNKTLTEATAFRMTFLIGVLL
jgi:hypothetical protein